MAQAALFSEHMGFSRREDTNRIVALLRRLGLPIDLPEFSSTEYTEALLHDKKVREGGLTFVANRGIGDFQFARITDVSVLLRACGRGE